MSLHVQDEIPFGQSEAAPPALQGADEPRGDHTRAGNPNVPAALYFIECETCGEDTEESQFKLRGCHNCGRRGGPA